MTEVTQDGLPADALGWITTALGTDDITVRSARIRPWSGVWQLASGTAGTVWFKANRLSGLHEPALTAALGSLGGAVDEPLATDPGRAWLLMSDSGSMLRGLLDAEPDGAGAQLTSACWQALLPRYAELQLATAALVPALAAAGVPTLTPLDHPGLFDDLLGEEEWLRPGVSPEMPHEVYARLCSAQAVVAEAADEVEAAGLPITVQHDDLHDGNVFVRGGAGPSIAGGRDDATGEPFRIIDWGDAYLGVPFATLLVTLRGIAHRFGLDTSVEPPALAPLVDAYLEPFTAPGRTLADLRGVLPSVLLLARIGRAESWRRMFAGDQRAAASLGWEDAMPGWLASVVDDAWI